MNTIKRIVLVIVLVAIIHYAVLIAWSISAVKFYAADRLSGLSHRDAMCNAGEFGDNIALAMGIDYREAKALQREFFNVWC